MAVKKLLLADQTTGLPVKEIQLILTSLAWLISLYVKFKRD